MKKKLYVVFFMILMLINILAINVSALSFTTTMTPSNTKIEAGTEVVVSVKLSSLEVGENGINIFTAVLGYDTDVFEVLTDTNIEGSNDWQTAYNSGTGKVTLTKTSYVKSDQEIMQITLKVKSDVADGTKGSVELSNVIASTPDDEIGGSNVSTTITVGNSGSTTTDPTDEPTEDPNDEPVSNIIVIPGNTTNQVRNDVVNNPTNTNQNINNGLSGTTNNALGNQTEGDMPYTGSETTAIIQIIIGIIIIALLIYRKIYSLEDV